MPVHRTTKNGKPAFQNGNHGTKYAYKAGDKAGLMRAKKKAIKQNVAIALSQGKKPNP